MMGWCPYDGEECRHDGYCKDCEHNKHSDCQEGKKSMIKKTEAKEVTVSDLTIMAEYVNKYKVEIELTISPDEQRMDVRPWKPMKYTTIYGGDEDDKRDSKQ